VHLRTLLPSSHSIIIQPRDPAPKVRRQRAASEPRFASAHIPLEGNAGANGSDSEEPNISFLGRDGSSAKMFPAKKAQNCAHRNAGICHGSIIASHSESTLTKVFQNKGL
jgi:hypothetical protein